VITCPRCGRENPPTAACAGCGTPLALGEEPSLRPLDRRLDLDRRGPERARAEGGGPPPSAGTPQVGAPFDHDRSDWSIGVPVDDGSSAGEPADAAKDLIELQPASAARRLSAWAIDGTLVAAAAVGLPAALLASTGPLGAVGSTSAAFASALPIVLPAEGFVAVAAFVYATVSHALAGATLGKRLARIRVVAPDGRPPGIARSAARSAWAVASFALLGLGLLPALLSGSGCALHDLLAGTRVVAAP